jgi:hypothetical protein
MGLFEQYPIVFVGLASLAGFAGGWLGAKVRELTRGR